LLLTNNENIEIFMHLATRKKLHCDMRNIAFRKTNDTHELGMQIEKDLEWSEPKTTPKWHMAHKDTSTHEGLGIIFVFIATHKHLFSIL
jgi:hypothetical protein